MGYPLRFFGGEYDELVGDVIIPARCTVEVTIRTHQQQFLLAPDAEANEIVGGCFGRALARYPDLNLHALSVLSDHIQFLCTPTRPPVLSDFMRDFLSTLAKRMNDHRDREGKFWERRYRAIPIADEATIEDRFRYILTQGTKENLVWSARDWPGLSSVNTLLNGDAMVGRWRDRKTEYERRRQRTRRIARAAARGETLELPEPPPIWIEYPIEHKPLPHLKKLSPRRRRRHVARILRDDDKKTRARHERDDTRPLGVTAVLATDPFRRADHPKRTPAPLCHAADPKTRNAFRTAYMLFVEMVRAATATLANATSRAGFLPGSTAPPITCRDERGREAHPIWETGPPALAAAVSSG